MSFRPASFAVCAASLCVHTLALAQAEPSVPELPAVAVIDQPGAQVERKQSELQKIVIAEDEVERYGDSTVGDVLRRLPGMTFTGPAGVTKDVRIRGLDKGYTQFLINGEPVPSATKERQIQIDRLPADMIERIEIIRTPVAGMDSDGVGGTINIVLKSRADGLTRLRAGWGQNGSRKVGDAVAQWSRSFGNLDVLFALSHTLGAEDVTESKIKFNADGSVKESEYKPKPVEKTEMLFAPRFVWRNGEDRLTLEPFLSNGTEDKHEQTALRNGLGVLTKNTDKREDKDDQVARMAGRYDGKTAWGSWFAKAGMQEARIDKLATSLERNGAGVLTKTTIEDERIRDRGSYGGAGVTFRVGAAHALSIGTEVRKSEYDNAKDKLENGVVKTAAKDIFNIEENRYILYAQDSWSLARGHTLTPGVRFERIERDATDSLGESRRSDFSASNPSLHYRWALRENTNLRASVARTFRMPKFDEVNPLVTLATGGGAGSATNPDSGGNADLKPERALGVELGVEHFFAGNRGVIGANLYQRRVEDFIEKQTLQEGARFVKRPYNAGEAHFWGVELDWRWPVWRNGAHRLDVTGNQSWMNGRVEYANQPSNGDVKDMPPRVTNIGINWTHQPTHWSAGLNLNLQPRFTTDGLNEDGVREVKTRAASTFFDVYVTKIFSPLAEVRLIARNVFGVDKEERTRKFKADGSFDSHEWKIERSHPTLMATFESRF